MLFHQLVLRFAILVLLCGRHGCVGGSDEDVLVSDLVSWLRENGAYVNAKLEVRHLVPDDPSSPRGVFATEDMEAGEKISSIPAKLILKSKPREELLEDGVPPPGHAICGTIKAAMEAMGGDDITPYGRYLQAQPKGYTPPFWSEAGRDLLATMLKSTKTHQLTEYDELPPHGVEEAFDDLELYCHGDVEDPLYVQAAMLVRARADYEFMVPFYDMINHDNDKYNIRHLHDNYRRDNIDETGYEIVTTKAMKAGDQLFNSYNRCNVCQEHLDWVGTPELFLEFGFVEAMPRRWLFDFARMKFDLDWKDGDESSGKLVVNFLVPPSEVGISLLREELVRLESFSTVHRNKSYKEYEGMSEYEWEMLWQYYDALRAALSNAVGSKATLSDDVWDLDDNWWVKDGAIDAYNTLEHYVLPTGMERTRKDEL